MPQPDFPQFPALKSGAITQYPSAVHLKHATEVLRYVDGSEQRWREQGATARSWQIHLGMIGEQEIAAVEEFFAARQGGFGQFAFTDPWDGVTHQNCSFDEDTLRADFFGDDWASSTLLIRTNK